MRDAFGGLMNMVIIIVFLVLVSGYLAFNVNYTKAFRVKNKIITTIEQYEGNCGNENSACNQEIISYMKELGYNADTNMRIDGYECQKGHEYIGVQTLHISYLLYHCYLYRPNQYCSSITVFFIRFYIVCIIKAHHIFSFLENCLKLILTDLRKNIDVYSE